MIDQLNKQFGLVGRVQIQAGEGNLPFIHIVNNSAKASICLLGGHVTSYIPNGQEDLLWMSSKSAFEVGKPIRGGIPVCWPWFGKNTENPDAPMHGLARIMMWEVNDIRELTPEQTEVILLLKDSPETHKFWDFKFELELKILIGETLTLTLTTINCDEEDFTISEALHSYFNISDIQSITILGFDEKPYLSKVGEPKAGVNHGPIYITKETDHVFQDIQDDAVIADPKFARTIVVSKYNSNSSVVWNPWIAKSQKMADFPDDGYKTMVCVETTNALEDARTVNAGEAFSLSTTISSQKSDL